MRMLLVFLIGTAGIAAFVLFCPPVREQVEAALFGEEETSLTSEPTEELNRPVTEAAEKAKSALGRIYEKAAETIGEQG
ncbi:MAG: hypothetical protein ACYS1C_09330 [Planctomycetota bacterium]